MRTKPFSNHDEYLKAYAKVTSYHMKVRQTLVDFLKEHGKVTFTEKEQNEDHWSFIEHDGTFTIKSMEEACDNVWLTCVDEYGYDTQFDWGDINHDLMIEDYLMEKIYSLNKE